MVVMQKPPVPTAEMEHFSDIEAVRKRERDSISAKGYDAGDRESESGFNDHGWYLVSNDGREQNVQGEGPSR